MGAYLHGIVIAITVIDTYVLFCLLSMLNIYKNIYVIDTIYI